MVKEAYRASLIYLADDETNIRNLLFSSLSHEEFAFRLLKMGIVFMGPFLVKNPDLLILDIMMP
ncbi:response regulator [Streptococcus parauberis]|uniref:response regulator transcription factor n=1 Tax=Streptococcus parauberis TaxID=1348 RepID=UPI000BBCCD19